MERCECPCQRPARLRQLLRRHCSSLAHRQHTRLTTKMFTPLQRTRQGLRLLVQSCTTPSVQVVRVLVQVLNAMLLACCSTEANPKDSCPEALEAIEMLLDEGAVPDTWAPNGNSVSPRQLLFKCPVLTASDRMMCLTSANRDLQSLISQQLSTKQALMMAASADSPKAIAMLLKRSAQINMKVPFLTSVIAESPLQSSLVCGSEAKLVFLTGERSL